MGTQYVSIDTFESKTIKSPDCSVIQGGKMSGILYTLYTNEVPILHKILNTNLFYKLTGYKNTKYNNIEHNTTNFVDDSSSIISL